MLLPLLDRIREELLGRTTRLVRLVGQVTVFEPTGEVVLDLQSQACDCLEGVGGSLLSLTVEKIIKDVVMLGNLC
jgi:hypothetical protein